MRIFMLIFFLTTMFLSPAFAYPEFQRYAKKISGRSVNCAMCHTHADGPQGLKRGQIGSLSDAENNELGLARQALKPGSSAHNPILNAFGNKILNDLGREKIMQLKAQPDQLPGALSKTSDLDGDGITDAEELKDGTHPLNSLDGLPLKLFKNNLAKNGFHILMIIFATSFGLFGLHHLLLWLSIKIKNET